MFKTLWSRLFLSGKKNKASEPVSAEPVNTFEVSYSKISTYRYCPWKYKLMYQDKWRQSPNPPISLGLSIHRALEDFHSQKRDDSFDQLMENYNAAWVNNGFATPQQAQEYYEKGERILARYWRDNSDRKSEILFVEKDFKFSLGDDRVRGIIDRIDHHPEGRYELIDYKTHSDPWSQERADSDLQMSIYALACRHALQLAPLELTFYFVSSGVRVHTERSEAQLDEARKIIHEVRGKIIDKQFEPHTDNCHRCDMHQRCPKSIAKNQS